MKALAQAGDGVIYAIWHNAMMLPLGHEAHHQTVALVSGGADGTFAARIVRHFGVGAIHGRTESARRDRASWRPCDRGRAGTRSS